ncbi:MAG: MBL fold metallo-hydrolase [Clostridia bacterium]|nr:MBL fold metallo-hydrolase [Clostridia bacterium]
MKKVFSTLFLLFFFAGSLTCSLPRMNSEFKRTAKQEPFSMRSKEILGTQGKLSVHFIDVGQGDSILVMTPSKKVVLIDAAAENRKNEVVSYLKKLDIKLIDILIATHPHDDHVGGMSEVIKKFSIQEAILPEAPFENNDSRDFIEALRAKKITGSTVSPGYCIKLDNVSFQVFAPCSKNYYYINNYSLVIKIVYGKSSFLLAGDAQFSSEEQMLSEGYNLKADVLKVGHHGSEGSSSIEFLNAVRPRYAVISVGKLNPYGHPNNAVIDRIKSIGAKVLRTDIEGDIILISDGNRIIADKYFKKAS